MGSEVLQGALPVQLHPSPLYYISLTTPQNGRLFDPYDVVANVAGSLSALALSSWYHRRMLERKRKAKHYLVVPTGNDVDLELGEGLHSEQETGVTDAVVTPSLEAEVDNWDENAEDTWEGDDPDETPASGGLEQTKAKAADS